MPLDADQAHAAAMQRRQGHAVCPPTIQASHVLASQSPGACSVHASQVSAPLGYANFVHSTQASEIARVLGGAHAIPKVPIKNDERRICTCRKPTLPAYPRRAPIRYMLHRGARVGSPIRGPGLR
jgi:hypothetical protein